jgi:hypothetical protein
MSRHLKTHNVTTVPYRFYPTLEQLEELVAPNDLGIFRSALPWQDSVDSWMTDIQLVGEDKTAADYTAPKLYGSGQVDNLTDLAGLNAE